MNRYDLSSLIQQEAKALHGAYIVAASKAFGMAYAFKVVGEFDEYFQNSKNAEANVAIIPWNSQSRRILT
ncbi:uncharacterized protein PHALS_14940 [Plasmopara halstedii]|uniref:Uncharacterized protein n=1 Tax=Plasmopara halstedii TaxID=4781 RepID=A0A0N7L7E5_PLAHL|nr:uncharacterized protein PHALS_14940 [Plasmopara halstedii]CEG46851.1 hypothetical protein PHALS_14940 [Plasmopara halstedii]|eukprot:XP_024583220.1 hypothetical protein PHALS_14940 [Plasmopara halstedii]